MIDSNFITQTRNFKYANVLLFAIFAATIHWQNCLFFTQLNPELSNNPFFHTTKIALAIFIASFVFLFRNKSWIIVVSLLINLWGISNLIYSRANGILIDAHSIFMINNMNGFWKSVPFFIELSDFICFISTLVVGISYFVFSNTRKSYTFGILAFFMSLIFHGYATERKLSRSIEEVKISRSIGIYNPFSLKKNFWIGFDASSYSQELSILHHFIYQINSYLHDVFATNKLVVSDMESSEIQRFVNFEGGGKIKVAPITSLVIILVESLENWVVIPDAMPNLCRFIDENDNILYALKVVSQTKGGTSADGQMIINTGLLPIEQGAACYRFPHHRYPSLSELYSSSCNIIPGSLSVWNQAYMNQVYCIGDSYTVSSGNNALDGDDIFIFQKYLEIYKSYDYSMVLTISTHSPFTTTSHKSNLILPDDMPKDMANYMKSFNYTDSCLNSVLSLVATDSLLRNATIVITSDHAIFPQNKREEYYSYCQERGLDYAINEAFCPLIVYSPNIEKKVEINTVAYQMDIYPTILNLIGCQNYFWKGFGVDLLEEGAIDKRPIEQNKAYKLSDKIISSNYFATIDL